MGKRDRYNGSLYFGVGRGVSYFLSFLFFPFFLSLTPSLSPAPLWSFKILKTFKMFCY